MRRALRSPEATRTNERDEYMDEHRSVKPFVLVVDDEPGVLRLVDLVLSKDGFRVLVAGNGMEALRVAEQYRPDLVILDICMPEMSGMEVMRRLKTRSASPIILLTAQTQDESKISGLEGGADDYIVKPFSPAELSARARAVLRRAHSSPGVGSKIQSDGVEIDLDSRLVKKDGKIIAFTRTEWRLLQELASNAGRVLLNEELLGRVWGPEYRDDLQFLRVWIARLRAKLERTPGEPKIITTFPGIGYMLGVAPNSTSNSDSE